ncbi:MAG TPA: phasin [Bryobacteraceae bacterium]|nr:phasin [Bryobacteraceae bacterium]
MRQTAETAQKTAERTFEAFQFPSYEMPEAFRSFAEQGMSQTREAYSRLKTATEEATDVLEETFATTRDSVMEMQFQALEAAKNNSDATYDFVKKLLGVTSVSDAVQLQTAYARERFEAFVDYSKEVQSSVGKISSDASKPAKVLFDRTVRQDKAA